jgi:hypothetical protein
MITGPPNFSELCSFAPSQASSFKFGPPSSTRTFLIHSSSSPSLPLPLHPSRRRHNSRVSRILRTVTRRGHDLGSLPSSAISQLLRGGARLLKVVRRVGEFRLVLCAGSLRHGALSPTPRPTCPLEWWNMRMGRVTELEHNDSLTRPRLVNVG